MEGGRFRVCSDESQAAREMNRVPRSNPKDSYPKGKIAKRRNKLRSVYTKHRLQATDLRTTRHVFSARLLFDRPCAAHISCSFGSWSAAAVSRSNLSWIYLLIAGLSEIGWAVGLKVTEGFSRLLPPVATWPAWS